MLPIEALISTLFLAANTVVAKNGIHVTITDDQRNVKDSSVHRKPGQLLSLNCSITPNIQPSPVITWYKNGIVLSVANTSDQWLVKNIYNTTPSDGGNYKCEAKYQGEVKDDVFVNMEGKPLIINCCSTDLITKTPMYVIASQILPLKCYGTGWPEPSFRWFHNGVQIKKDDQKSGNFQLEQVQNGLILTLYGLMKKDGGKYTCEAKNSYGTDTRTIPVTVLGGGSASHPEIKPTQSHIHAAIGQPNVTLSCVGERVRKSDADTIWYYNGKELAQDNGSNEHLVFKTYYYDQRTPGVTRKVRMSLIINNVTKYDEGNYTCEVTTDKTVNSTIILTVGKNEPNKPRKDVKALKLGEIIAIVIAIFAAIFVAMFVLFRKKRKKVERPKLPKGTFKYGAFITYSSQDYAWVEGNLLPLLKENGIETCIHFRNFDIGVLLEQNMVNCVYNSRVVIVIMSKSYMKSKYCKSELDYAIHRAVEEPDSNSLITLRIDKGIKESELPKAIRNKTFLDVASDVEKDTWKKRLLMHVKDTYPDQNRNIVEQCENRPNFNGEQETLLNPCQDNVHVV